MKKIVILLVLALVVSAVSFGYMIATIQSNELNIEIGVPDNATATIETDLLNKVLIPYNATPTQSNEVTEYRVYLRVNYDDMVSFTVSDNLPSEYQITYSASTFLTNTNYTLTIKLLEPVQVSIQTLQLTINF